MSSPRMAGNNSSVGAQLSVRRMQTVDVPQIVNLHLNAISYSLNAKLGKNHLVYLYNTTSSDEHSIVLVALKENICAGMCSATINPQQLTKKLLFKLPMRRWAGIFFKIIQHPGLLRTWHETNSLGAPVIFNEKSIIPCLTTIVVDEKFRREGVGRALILAVEEFFKSKQYFCYRLDTLASNFASRSFYLKNGFTEVAQRGRHIMLVKAI